MRTLVCSLYLVTPKDIAKAPLSHDRDGLGDIAFPQLTVVTSVALSLTLAMRLYPFP